MSAVRRGSTPDDAIRRESLHPTRILQPGDAKTAKPMVKVDVDPNALAQSAKQTINLMQQQKQIKNELRTTEENSWEANLSSWRDRRKSQPTYQPKVLELDNTAQEIEIVTAGDRRGKTFKELMNKKEERSNGKDSYTYGGEDDSKWTSSIDTEMSSGISNSERPTASVGISNSTSQKRADTGYNSSAEFVPATLNSSGVNGGRTTSEDKWSGNSKAHTRNEVVVPGAAGYMYQSRDVLEENSYTYKPRDELEENSYTYKPRELEENSYRYKPREELEEKRYRYKPREELEEHSIKTRQSYGMTGFNNNDNDVKQSSYTITLKNPSLSGSNKDQASSYTERSFKKIEQTDQSGHWDQPTVNKSIQIPYENTRNSTTDSRWSEIGSSRLNSRHSISVEPLTQRHIPNSFFKNILSKFESIDGSPSQTSVKPMLQNTNRKGSLDARLSRLGLLGDAKSQTRESNKESVIEPQPIERFQAKSTYSERLLTPGARQFNEAVTQLDTVHKEEPTYKYIRCLKNDHEDVYLSDDTEDKTTEPWLSGRLQPRKKSTNCMENRFSTSGTYSSAQTRKLSEQFSMNLAYNSDSKRNHDHSTVNDIKYTPRKSTNENADIGRNDCQKISDRVSVHGFCYSPSLAPHDLRTSIEGKHYPPETNFSGSSDRHSSVQRDLTKSEFTFPHRAQHPSDDSTDVFTATEENKKKYPERTASMSSKTIEEPNTEIQNHYEHQNSSSNRAQKESQTYTVSPGNKIELPYKYKPPSINSDDDQVLKPVVRVESNDNINITIKRTQKGHPTSDQENFDNLYTNQRLEDSDDKGLLNLKNVVQRDTIRSTIIGEATFSEKFIANSDLSNCRHSPDLLTEKALENKNRHQDVSHSEVGIPRKVHPTHKEASDSSSQNECDDYQKLEGQECCLNELQNPNKDLSKQELHVDHIEESESNNSSDEDIPANARPQYQTPPLLSPSSDEPPPLPPGPPPELDWDPNNVHVKENDDSDSDDEATSYKSPVAATAREEMVKQKFKFLGQDLENSEEFNQLVAGSMDKPTIPNRHHNNTEENSNQSSESDE